MKKRILSFFLAIISTFSLVVPVFATNTQLSNNPDKVISTIDYAVTIDECTIDDDNYKDADYTKYGCSESYYQWWG